MRIFLNVTSAICLSDLTELASSSSWLVSRLSTVYFGFEGGKLTFQGLEGFEIISLYISLHRFSLLSCSITVTSKRKSIMEFKMLFTTILSRQLS